MITVPDPPPLYELSMHIKIMHGVWVGDLRTAAELEECHRECHTYPIGPEVPHRHREPDGEGDDWEW